MFDFQFRLQPQPVVEAVAGKQHEAVEVDLIGVAAVVVHLAIAAQRGALPPTITTEPGIGKCGFDHTTGGLDPLFVLRQAGFDLLDARNFRCGRCGSRCAVGLVLQLFDTCLQCLQLFLLGLQHLPQCLAAGQVAAVLRPARCGEGHHYGKRECAYHQCA